MLGRGHDSGRSSRAQPPTPTLSPPQQHDYYRCKHIAIVVNHHHPQHNHHRSHRNHITTAVYIAASTDTVLVFYQQLDQPQPQPATTKPLERKRGILCPALFFLPLPVRSPSIPRLSLPSRRRQFRMKGNGGREEGRSTKGGRQEWK